jgi:hypothetical protein
MPSQVPPRERKPRSFWFDPRFAIGLLLVVASVAGVLAVVASADSSATVYSARTSLSVGDRITVDDLVEESVRLGSITEQYLGKDAVPADGLIVTRTVSRGELVPVSSVGSVAGERVASVVITVTSRLPRAVDAGAVVDVWASREGEGGVYGPPSVLVPSATVVQVIEADGIIAGAGAVSVELLVPRAKVARALESIANADALSLIPVNLPVTSAAKG